VSNSVQKRMSENVQMKPMIQWWLNYYWWNITACRCNLLLHLTPDKSRNNCIASPMNATVDRNISLGMTSNMSSQERYRISKTSNSFKMQNKMQNNNITFGRTRNYWPI